MRGSWFALFFRVMPALVWDGIEAWWGGQAVSTMIGTWSLTWADWDYPIANNTAQLKDFIGCMWQHPFCPFLLSYTVDDDNDDDDERLEIICERASL